MRAAVIEPLLPTCRQFACQFHKALRDGEECPRFCAEIGTNMATGDFLSRAEAGCKGARRAPGGAGDAEDSAANVSTPVGRFGGAFAQAGGDGRILGDCAYWLRAAGSRLRSRGDRGRALCETRTA